VLVSVLDHVYGVDPAADRVAGALLPLGGHILEPETAHDASRRIVGGGKRHAIVASPGSVQLVSGLHRGWVRDCVPSSRFAVASAALANAVAQLDRLDVRLYRERGSWFGEWDYFAEREYWSAQLDLAREALGLVAHPSRRGCVSEWSRKSRARMVRRLSTLDWSGLRCDRLRRPAMVTLTYPGDWLRWCPDAATVKRHLRSFRSALERKLGPCPGVWKLEFQLRGAPHVHLLLSVPRGSVFRDWCRSTWARIVRATGQDRAYHELAGVSVDFREGERYSDPQRIAVYFSKHGAASGSKEYQHRPPEAWLDGDGAGTGRWWGYWRLRPLEVEAIVPREAAVEAARVLRGWVKAQRRTRRVARKRVNRATGVVTMRQQTERFTVRALGFTQPGGFVLANDGPALAAAVCRAVSEVAEHPPGVPRGLP